MTVIDFGRELTIDFERVAHAAIADAKWEFSFRAVECEFVMEKVVAIVFLKTKKIKKY